MSYLISGFAQLLQGEGHAGVVDGVLSYQNIVDFNNFKSTTGKTLIKI
jgi:hypothetical protein